jgi:hypothetical protein
MPEAATLPSRNLNADDVGDMSLGEKGSDDDDDDDVAPAGVFR